MAVIKRRKVDEYKMQMAVIQNPHTKDPKKLWQTIDNMVPKSRPDKLDVAGFEVLKIRLQQNPRFVVKNEVK
jgi:hypothetical protein